MYEVCYEYVPYAGTSAGAAQTGTLSPGVCTLQRYWQAVTAALNNSSVFAAVCSKRTGKDRHLLLTTNAGGGGETQSLSCGGVCGGSIVLIEGGKKQGGCLTTTLIPTGASSSRCWMKRIAVITASWELPPFTSPRPTSTQDCTSCSDFSSSWTFRAGQW